MRIFLLVTSLTISTALAAQLTFYDENADKWYNINPDTPRDIVERFLDHHQASEIEFNTTSSAGEFPLRIQNKKGHWMLYSESEQEFLFTKEAGSFSFEFPHEALQNRELHVAQRKNQSYLFGLYKKPLRIESIAYTTYPSRYPFQVQLKNRRYTLYDDEISQLLDHSSLQAYSFERPVRELEREYLFVVEKKGLRYLATDIEGMEVFESLPFDRVVPVQVEQVNDYYDSWKEALVTDTSRVLSHLALERDGLWGAAHFSIQTGQLNRIAGFHYPSFEALPEAFDYTEDELEVINTVLSSTSAKYARPLRFGNQNYVLLEVTPAEGAPPSLHLQCVGNCKTEQLPSGDFRVVPHEEDQVLEVWQNDRVGLWNSEVVPVVPCEYDAYSRVHLDYFYGCGFQKNGTWQLFDCQTGELLIEQSAASIDELQNYWLNR